MLSWDAVLQFFLESLLVLFRWMVLDESRRNPKCQVSPLEYYITWPHYHIEVRWNHNRLIHPGIGFKNRHEFAVTIICSKRQDLFFLELRGAMKAPHDLRQVSISLTCSQQHKEPQYMYMRLFIYLRCRCTAISPNWKFFNDIL